MVEEEKRAPGYQPFTPNLDGLREQTVQLDGNKQPYNMGNIFQAFQQQLIAQEKQKYDEEMQEAKDRVEADRKSRKAERRAAIQTDAITHNWSDEQYQSRVREEMDKIDADCDKELQKAQKKIKKGENFRRSELDKLDKQSESETAEEGAGEGTSEDGDKSSEDGKEGEKKDGEKSSEEDKDKESTNTAVPTLVASGLGAYWDKNFGGAKDPMGRKEALEQQSKLHNVEAGEHRAAAQRENKIANEDARREAGLDGADASFNKNQQKVANRSFASAGASALERTEEYGDPNIHRNRADQARQKGVENTEKAYDEDQIAIQERNAANVYDYKAKETEASNNVTDTLSKGDGDKGGKTPETTKASKPEEDTKPKTTTETVTETQEFEPQKAFNYMAHGLDPTSQQNPNGKSKNGYVGDEVYAQGKQYATTKREGDDAWTDAVQAEANKGPITPDEVKEAGENPNDFPGGTPEGEGKMQTIVAKYRPNWYKWWQGASERFKNGQQINRGDKVGGETADPSKMGNTQTTTTKTVTKDENGNIVQGGGTGSDYRVKNIVSAIAYDPRS